MTLAVPGWRPDMPLDDDALVAHLRARAEPTSCHALANWLAGPLEHETRKAYWSYAQAAQRLGWRVRPTFSAHYLQRQAEYYLSAAYARPAAPAFAVPPATLILTWHHPAAPVLMAGVRATGVLTLIAQRAEWMGVLMGEGNLLAFRDAGSSMRLLRAFRQQRVVSCMIDFCYDDTAYVEGPFLGHRARTPRGVFALAERFGYVVWLVSFADHRPYVAARFAAGTHGVAALVAQVNALLEAEIRSDPPAWLLWPALDRRVTDFDYGQARSGRAAVPSA